MKKFIVLILVLNCGVLSAAMTKEFVVTRLNYDTTKKNYQVDFKNQAGVYRASGEPVLSCLQYSLREAKAVKIVFNPMGLAILNCAKVSTK